MATQQTHGAQVVSKIAGADLSASKHLFVKYNAAGQVVPITATTDVPAGVVLETAKAGFEVLIGLAGTLKVVAGGTLAVGAAIGVDATGKAITVVPGTDITKYVVGRVTRAASGTGIITTAQIDTLAPARAV